MITRRDLLLAPFILHSTAPLTLSATVEASPHEDGPESAWVHLRCENTQGFAGNIDIGEMKKGNKVLTWLQAQSGKRIAMALVEE